MLILLAVGLIVKALVCKHIFNRVFRGTALCGYKRTATCLSLICGIATHCSQ